MLREQIRKARQSEGGFTLVELLMVIVVLGILSTIVVFAVNGINDKGQASACKADKSTVETAVEAYYATKDAYPGSLQDLVTAGFLHSVPDGTVTLGTDGHTVTYAATCTAAGL